MKYTITLVRPETGSRLILEGKTYLSSFALGEKIAAEFPGWINENFTRQYNVKGIKCLKQNF